MKNLREIIMPVISEIKAGKKDLEISELWGTARALFLSGLQRETREPVLVITATEEEAETLLEDLRFFAGTKGLFPEDSAGKSGAGSPERNDSLFLFPDWGLLPFEADSPDTRTVGERMRFLYNLLSGAPGIYAVPAISLMQKLPPRGLFIDSVKNISAATPIDPDGLVNALVSTGYESASLVTRVGEFSMRGGILDFFSPYHSYPVRIEFFGDHIESIREFDPETQRSIKEIPEAVLLPACEVILTSSGRERFLLHVHDEAVRDQIDQGILPAGAEFLAPFLYEMEDLFQYLPEDSPFTLIEPEDIHKMVAEQLIKIEQGREEEQSSGRTLPETTSLYLSVNQIASARASYRGINLRLLGNEVNAGFRMDTKSAAWLGIRLTRSLDAEEHKDAPLEGTVSGLVEKLKELRKSNQILIICGTEEAGVRLKGMLAEYGLGAILGSRISAPGTGPSIITILIGRLSEGFSWPDTGLILITEEEIFGKKIHRPQAKKAKIAPFLSSFKELKPGDFVVHTDYGVGEYQGLSHISLDGYETDFLTLRYEPDAKLYVPLYSLDKVQKYIGVEGSTPKLDRLGAPQWAKTKEKIRKDILEMARELVKVYAAREAIQRKPYSPPDTLYREFESTFPYDETPDQERAIEDVLADMQQPRPMDRLICGDVGYGKTEVALRAAFKAIEDGLQVAVLVPTTLLADQHYRTFSGRLGPFTVRVEMLSRFRTKTEQQETIKGLKSGSVDIVIGTHRLLQRDITFGKLGLLIVDEEHKFGVRHKERIKEFKKLVDVLTLTATPIPRTLHMSLAGIRELSIIQTPPLDRQSIQVVLARFSPRVVREAIVKEIERGGQVFFIHNRVQGIERMANFIRSLVPQATVGIGHGQMKDEEIESVMAKFISGEVKVLITTTIIESGIDIPSANTIIINRADQFGLADLYQIKGRVGRSREKAFAYLLTPAEETLSDVARKRLRAIQELSELGAGFRIAAQDLETRGAGNLLGKQQSGHIAAIGIDLYTQMMEEAVSELRGEETAEETDTLINLPVSAYIPENYIGDVSLRLSAYKEIAGVRSEQEIGTIMEDLRDRYGAPPDFVRNLVEIMKIKIAARNANVARIDGGNHVVNITFAEHAHVAPEKIMKLLKRNRGRIKLIPEYTLQLAVPDHALATLSDAVKKCLQELG